MHFRFWGVEDDVREARVMPPEYPAAGVNTYGKLGRYWLASRSKWRLEPLDRKVTGTVAGVLPVVGSLWPVASTQEPR